MTGYLPPILPVPPPIRMIHSSGAETAESKERTAQWKAESARIAEENEERRRHNKALKEQKVSDKIQLNVWFDEEGGRATRFWIGDQDGREVEGAVYEGNDGEYMTIKVPMVKGAEND